MVAIARKHDSSGAAYAPGTPSPIAACMYAQYLIRFRLIVTPANTGSKLMIIP